MLNRREILAAGAAAFGLSQFPLGYAAAQGEKKKKILMFTRSQGYEHSSIKRQGDELSHAEKVFTELGKKHGFDVTATKDGRVFDSSIEQYDAFFFYTTGDLTQPKEGEAPAMSPAGKKKFLDAVAAGKGFLASHCGSDTFHSKGSAFEKQKEPDPYIAMLGGEFIRHGPQQKARQVVASAKFPGLEGVGKAFEMNEEWYSLKNFAENLHVILVQDTQGMTGSDYDRPPFPATWARTHQKGRVFYTSMGHREDVWTSPTFQQILLGGVSWVLKNVDADVTPNLKEVTPGARVMPPMPK